MRTKQMTLPVAVAAGLFLASPPAGWAQHPRGVHTTQDLAFVKAKVEGRQQPWLAAHDDLIAHADSALSHTPQAMADFAVPGYYGSGQAEHIRMKTLMSDDAMAAYVCALAWHLDVGSDPARREAYGRKAIEILNDWGQKNTKYSGGDGSLVMSYNGHMLAKAADLMHSSGLWPNAGRTAFAGWVRNVLLKAGDSIDENGNNWGDWGTLAVTVSACFLDDDTRLAALPAHLAGRIADAIADDGHLPKETSRGENGMWYTYFALAPMTEACAIVRKNTGTDLFDTTAASGRELKKALDFFLACCKDVDLWPYTKPSNPPQRCPTCWPGNMYEAMAEIFDDSEYEAFAVPGRPYYRKATGLAWSVSTLFKGTLSGEAQTVSGRMAPMRANAAPLEAAPRILFNGRSLGQGLTRQPLSPTPVLTVGTDGGGVRVVLPR